MASTLGQVLAEIEPAGDDPARRARRRLSGRRGLGVLGELAVRLAAARHVPLPPVDRKMLVVCAADHGMGDAGSADVVNAVAAGSAEVNVLARDAGARVAVVDCGLRDSSGLSPAVLSLPIAADAAGGEGDAAMTADQALAAIETGIALTLSFASDGIDLLAVGQASTAGSAAAAARLIDALLADADADGIELLARAGAFDLAVAAGLCLGAAAIRVPVVLDGVGAPAAALAAARIAPAVTGYLFAGHAGVDDAARRAIAAIDLTPLLDLGMTAGDGATAAAALPIVSAAARLLREPATQRRLYIVDDD